eukprot:Nk52_evm53s239 gene=Nk52_evmTU53s239
MSIEGGNCVGGSHGSSGDGASPGGMALIGSSIKGMVKDSSVEKNAGTDLFLSRSIMVLSYAWMQFVAWSSVLGALILSFVWSVWYDGHRVNDTHCHVWNWLPTISATVGNYTPQRYFWRYGIAIMMYQRILDAILFYKFYQACFERLKYLERNRGRRINSFMNLIGALLHCSEYFFLGALTYVSSSENGFLHSVFFVVFMLSAILNMMVKIRNHKETVVRDPQCSSLSKGKYTLQFIGPLRISNTVNSIINPFKLGRFKTSYMLKKRCFTTMVASFAACLYFYYRHNTFCEPGGNVDWCCPMSS